ncbi:ABC transporter permease [Anaerocolumna cellulosilytica]|uniref:ABC transporter permease n=1 Tax=Anaerocolumna cellulosilytica TaxID=433286 RepID=A0A6S6R846_9FIRM|nr:putative ABC exporter domain-containing protein [Anaerocolumna cellulosilytica]MBB5198037.1 hypothetical protein [Anaerocolumna cellulosilytica]BCJ95178.1 ABC transporter permease [Anaerocolumna cellulosilytica]
MKALGYLLLMTLKNRILSLKKKPAMLILYLVITAFVVVMVVFSGTSEISGAAVRHGDIRILYSIIVGVGLLFLYSFVSTGISTGSTLFNMADVGLLFVSPLSSKKILVYGLIKQAATTLVSALFILYQVGNLKSSFGMGITNITHVFLVYAILVFFCQLLSIAIYIFTNGNRERKQLVKGVFIVFLLLILAGIYYQYTVHGDILVCLLSLMEFKPFQFLPVVGWAVMFMQASIEGSIVYLLVSLALFLGSSIAIIALFTSGEADYYEDVLHSTEVNYEKLEKVKEGKTFVSNRKIKVKDAVTGLQKGKGHTAIFYKHLLEVRRGNRFAYLDTYTLLASAGAGILCYFVQESFSVYIVLGILVYIQFFTTILGKLSMELTKPYIYMIPEKSIKKVLMASMTTLLKPCFDAVVIFTVVCIFSKTSPLLNLFLALAYASTGALFVGYTLLCQRVFGGQPNKLIQATLGLALLFLVMAPGIGTSVAAIAFLPSALIFLGTLPYTFCCLVISAGIFAGCGNLLDKAEYGGK